MYHHFIAPQISTGNNWANVILTAVSAFAAVGSAYFAFKSIQQNRVSQIPILQPEIGDVANPHLLKLIIKNVGNGLAKNIKATLVPINQEMFFGSDLLPRKYEDHLILTWDVSLTFEAMYNPLFHEGKLLLSYQDIWGKEYSMKAIFKPDAVPARRNVGHLDRNFAGYFY
ncbi:MAG: hypothetical protein P4L74_06530 [Candidatus Doudnabacteria bacterium]|nr:hypothetical protein [Candidatus Doudnabacteria bacterium]